MIHRAGIDVIGRRPGMEGIGSAGAVATEQGVEPGGRRPGMDRVGDPDKHRSKAVADAQRATEALRAVPGFGPMRVR